MEASVHTYINTYVEARDVHVPNISGSYIDTYRVRRMQIPFPNRKVSASLPFIHPKPPTPVPEMTNNPKFHVYDEPQPASNNHPTARLYLPNPSICHSQLNPRATYVPFCICIYVHTWATPAQPSPVWIESVDWVSSLDWAWMVWYAWMDGFFRCGMDRIHGKMYEYRCI